MGQPETLLRAKDRASAACRYGQQTRLFNTPFGDEPSPLHFGFAERYFRLLYSEKGLLLCGWF